MCERASEDDEEGLGVVEALLAAHVAEELGLQLIRILVELGRDLDARRFTNRVVECECC